MRTSQLVAIRRMWGEGATYAEMSEATGLPTATISWHVQHHRDEFPTRKHHIEWWAEQLATVEGLTCSKAAEALGTSRFSISKWRRRVAQEVDGWKH